MAILHHYVVWHYTQAFFQFFNIWRNLIWFVVHFFSLPDLLRSWIAPWKRITETRAKAWDVEDFIGTIIINLLSRIIGFIMRTIVIILGTFSLFATLIGGVGGLLVWVVAPALIIFLLILGVAYII